MTRSLLTLIVPLATWCLTSFTFMGFALADADFDNYVVENTDNYLDDKDRNTMNRLNSLNQNQMAGHSYVPGLVTFTFGDGIPTVVCAVLEITDIMLEKGERILSVQLGDTLRWNIDSAVSGDDSERVEHLIVKPQANALKTSLLIATDRRTYHIRLKSTANDFMPQVSFHYPNSHKIVNQNNNFSFTGNTRTNSNYGQRQSVNNGVQPRMSITSRDGEMTNNVGNTGRKASSTRYRISGGSTLRPKNVFDGGQTTYVVFGDEIEFNSLPTVNAVHIKKGFLVDEEQLSNVNFRFDGQTMVLDGLFKKIKLTFDADNEEDSVMIRKA